MVWVYVWCVCVVWVSVSCVVGCVVWVCGMCVVCGVGECLVWVCGVDRYVVWVCGVWCG